MKTVSVRLPEDLYAKIDLLSKQRGASKSEVIRDALKAYFSHEANSVRLSCLDLARDLVGSVEGPADLATNPKYMRGFGQ
jgi:Arc/MetJ-type ribon-helix-helix transcriptional regulator